MPSRRTRETSAAATSLCRPKAVPIALPLASYTPPSRSTAKGDELPPGASGETSTCASRIACEPFGGRSTKSTARFTGSVFSAREASMIARASASSIPRVPGAGAPGAGCAAAVFTEGLLSSGAR